MSIAQGICTKLAKPMLKSFLKFWYYIWFMILIISLTVHCHDKLYFVCFVLLVSQTLSLAKLVNMNEFEQLFLILCLYCSIVTHCCSVQASINRSLATTSLYFKSKGKPCNLESFLPLAMCQFNLNCQTATNVVSQRESLFMPIKNCVVCMH